MCHIATGGTLFSYLDNGSAQFDSITVTSNAISETPEENLQSAIALLDGMTSVAKGTKTSLNAKLQAALRVLKVNDTATSKNILNALQQNIEAQRAKGLTDAPATALLDKAKAVF